MVDENARRRVLAELGSVSQGTDEALQAVARLAADWCGTAMAAVSIVGAAEQVFVASVGLAITGSDRASSFCAVALQTPRQPLLVPDTTLDPRFATNPLVVGEPHLRAYAGVPLLSAEKVPLGSVCVLDTRPFELSATQLAALTALGKITERVLQAERLAEKLHGSLAALSVAHQVEKASKEQFQTAFDHATTGLTLVDGEGVFVRVNRAFADMLGYPATELVGRSFRDVTVDADQGADVAAAQALVDGTRRAALREKRYRRRDGSFVPALVSSSLIQPVTGGPWQMLNSIESLAERRAAEERLLELHSAVDGIISIDEHSRVVAWNLGAERLLGYAAAEMIGRPLDRIIPAGSRAAHHAGVARLAAGGGGRLLGTTVEVPAVHADGRQLLTELSLSAWSQDGRPRYTAILRDITAARRAEQAAALVRHAAVTANSSDTFVAAAAAVVREVCDRLGWRAGNAWTTDGGPAVWHVADHAHGDRCALRELADGGDAPTEQDVPFEAVTRTCGPEDLEPMGAAVPECGVGGAVAVPVLAGGEVTGMLAFYLPAGGPPAADDVVTALEQVGLALGRVVERQRSSDTLAWQANHDPVTDLANRRLLLERIRQAAPPSALLLINLDRFRLVNDSLGYAVGDLVLRMAGARLRHAAGEDALVARLSADEFVVLTRQPTADGARQLAERVQRALREPLTVGGHQVWLRASVGICPITAARAATSHNPAGVLRDADSALRLAKRRGEEQVVTFDAALADTADRRVADEIALAQAITGGGLRLHYQPIVGLETGRPNGAEALVRWERPGHGLVPPDRFIPLAEDSGLIVDLGRWVLRQACHDAAAWPRAVPAMADASISVNVSARQLTHPRFIEDLDAALADSGLAPYRLILEITESALISEPDAVIDTLHAVRARGAQLALDDFGTGYSSLSYVQKLPATILKIDKSFVDAITAPGPGSALSEVVIKLAQALGLRTVAEGVEHPDQATALRLLGCDRGQGYAWARPVPQEDLANAVTLLTGGAELTELHRPA